MIDWLTFVAPLTHQTGVGGPFFAGEVLSTIPDATHPDGERLEWGIWKRKSMEGSHSQVIQVKSCTTEAGMPGIWVSGNPAKWFQGHNVFGSDDLPGLVREMLHRVCASVGVVPSEADRAFWDAGAVALMRVDVTYSLDLGTTGRVRAALQALDLSARLKHRGRGHFKGDSITFGKGSRRWSLTLYAKGPELLEHPLPHLLQETSIPAHAAGLLRAEIRMQGLELKREGLSHVCNWEDNPGAELHQRLFAGLEIAEATMLEPARLEGLPLRLQSVYQLWADGHDLRQLLSRPTFYRHRKALSAFGVDIAVKRDRPGEGATNVVPLRLVLTATPSGVPDWAVGTPLYFEPRSRVA